MRTGIAVIGAGQISDQYLTQLVQYPDLEVRFVGDQFPERSAQQAEKHSIRAHGSLDEALVRDDVELVVNLTNPHAHAAVSEAALRAGKHVWSEKPFAIDRDDARRLMEIAADRQLRLGSAPDTFLGIGVQTALRSIQRGDIGEPLSALTLFETPGPRPMHPNLQLMYSRGAGPLLDMGPYYFTALVLALGSVTSVIANSRTSRQERIQRVGPHAGEPVVVTVPTNVTVLTRFRQDRIGTTVLSWDSPIRRDGWCEVTGTEGTLVVPDPNQFHGDLRIKRFREDDWSVVPVVGPASGRGVGALEIARAVREGRPHRASPELAYHVLDVMLSAAESLEQNAWVDVASTAPSVALLPTDWDPAACTVG